MTNPNEIWQVEAGGQIYETNFAELADWISEGSLLPEDKVRHGNLRWITAEKVPLLSGFFNAKKFGVPAPIFENAGETAQTSKTFQAPTDKLETKPTVLQNDFKNQFGKADADIDAEIFQTESPIVSLVNKTKNNYKAQNVGAFSRENAAADGFGFADFGRAVIYPFKFKTSLFFGAALFVFFTLGESVAAFGISMYFAAIVCFMLANTLVFGCLANTLENFARGKTGANFMPDFDEFTIWDDVIEPFFLSLAVYFISFGLLIVLIVGAFWYASGFESQIEADKQKIISVVLPAAPNNSNSAEQMSQINQLSKQLKADNQWQSGNMSTENDVAQIEQNSAKQSADIQNLQESIRQNLQAQNKSQNSENSETESFGQTAGKVMRLSLVFSVPIFLALLWGIFYFPVACAIAGYTKSFAAILNPAIAFDTIKRLGLDYLKILGMFLILIATAFGLNAILQTIFAPLNLPLLGNLPAKATVGIFAFYLSIVFSVILGAALHKATSRLNIHRA